MFQTAVITDEISQDPEIAVRLAVKYELDAVEIRSVYGRDPFELTDADIGKIKSVVSAAGLSVCCIAAPFFKCRLDNPAEQDAHMEGLKRCIELADLLGTTLIRGFTFWKTDSSAVPWEEIAEKLMKPAELLARAGKVMALESDPSVNAANAASLAKIIALVDKPSVRALWDPGNDLYDPAGEIPYPDGYGIIRPYMVHMHLKDAVRRNGTAAAVPVGKGAVDFTGQFRQLVRDDYRGFVSLETHYRPAHTFSETELALPKGEQFSYRGLEATEECLILWKQLLESAGISLNKVLKERAERL